MLTALWTARLTASAIAAAWLARAAIASRARRGGGVVVSLGALAVLAAADSLAAALGAAADGAPRSALAAGEALAACGLAIGLAARPKVAPAPLADPDLLARWLQILAGRTEEAMIVTDARRRIEWVNEGFTRITGYEPDEVLGRTPEELLSGPETDPAVRGYVAQRLKAGKSARAEVLSYGKNGRTYWAAKEIRPLFDDDGRLVNFLSVQTDVTERKRAERRLEAQYAVMRILGDGARLEDAAPHLLATIGRTLEFDVAAFWTWDRSTRAPRPSGRPWTSGRVAASWTAEAPPGPLPAVLAEPMARVWATGAPAWVSEIVPPRQGAPGPAMPEALRGLRGMAVVPVADGEKSPLVGLLTLFRREPMQRDEPLLQVLSSLGRQIGLFAERRKALREQVEINTRLNAILDASTQSGIVATDPGGLITIFNAGAERMFGYKAAELVGRTTPLILHDPDELAARCLDAAAETGKPARGFETVVRRARRDGHEVSEWTFVRKDGARIPVLLAVTAARDPEGTLRGFLVVVTDLSRLQAAERRIRESESRLRRLVEADIFGVAFGDPTGGLTDANDAFLHMLGYSRDDLADGGVHWLKLLVDASPDRIRRRRVQLARHGSCPPFEVEVRRKDGRAVPVLLGLARLDDARDDARAPFVAFCLDLSERKALEDQLRRHVDELAEADRRKNQFIAMLGHELRNPLAPIRNAARVMKQRDDAATIAWARDVIDRQVAQLSRLVDDLLEIARLERGKIALKLGPTDAAAVVAAAVETVAPEIDARGHRLEVVVPEAAVLVTADPIRMGQVLSNLLHNAAKYTEDGGSIRISVAAEAAEAVFRVRDDGIGIPAAVLGRIFDVFTQDDRTLDRSQGGLGLGLPLVRGLAEMHGGTVSAFSEGPGRGSEFVVRLPLLKVVETESLPSAVAVPPPAVAAVPAASPRRILIVDDNVRSAESLAMILQFEGHRVRVVHDGPSALATARAEPFDVVFMDIGLPGMDGYQVARDLRGRPETTGLPLVAVTGYAEDEARRRSREAGFDHHLVKPVDPDAILAVVASLEWNAGAAPAPASN